MASLSHGGITLICNNKNGCAPINTFLLAANTAMTFTHGLGTKHGNGYAAFKVRVLDVNGADCASVTGAKGPISVLQPTGGPNGLIDSIVIQNQSVTDVDIVVEITWEVLSPQVQLVEGSYTEPGVTLPSPYPDIVATFN